MKTLEKKSSFLFLIIIAVMTLIIAVLATFILLVGINGTTMAAEGAEPGDGGAAGGGGAYNTIFISPPDEEELSAMLLLDTGKPINLKSENPQKPSYAIIEMSIKYFNSVDGIKDINSKMSLNKANLQEIVTTYFMAMDVEEFSQYETKITAKNELKEQLNIFLISTIAVEKDRRKVKEVVYDVVFSAWNYN
jgi:flagellar basal body-associated protein FliL